MLNSVSWLVQFLLFAAFGIGAWMKTLFPIAQFAAIWPWAGDLPAPAVRGVGVIDLLGGVGVFLPMLTGILPGLTVPAALGCVALQIYAMVFHIVRREFDSAPVIIILLAMSAFVAWGRLRFNLGDLRPEETDHHCVPLQLAAGRFTASHVE